MIDPNDISAVAQAANALAPIAKQFIDKISNAIGLVFEPVRVKRLAKAEAEAEWIKTEGQMAVADLKLRTFQRLYASAHREQRNIEEIISLALPNIAIGAEPTKMEDDWITNFFDKCKLISDGQMQSIWSKILSGEANAPGTFSKRTVSMVAILEKKEADMFTNLCKFSWAIGGSRPIVFNYNDEIYQSYGLDHDLLNHLQTVGLITFAPLTSYILKLKVYEHLSWVSISYFGREISISLKSIPNFDLNGGQVCLTEVGQQLATICGSQPADDIFEHTRREWVKLGYEVRVRSEP